MIECIDSKLLKHIEIAPRQQLLKEGEITRKLFFIKKGIVRVWFDNNGNEMTSQFFFEGDAATSLECFIYNQPSPFTIEAIEPCEVAVLSKFDFDSLLEAEISFKEWFYDAALKKLIFHSNRLMSFIRNNPEKRYQELKETRPELLERIPQIYIASYLGITAVSLSRIKNRK